MHKRRGLDPKAYDQARFGFALLEAIVAIAVLAAALVPIFGLVSASLNNAFRLSQAELRAELEMSALEVIYSVNPMVQPKGQIGLPPYRVEWTANRVTPDVDSVNFPRNIGLYVVALFNTEVIVRDGTGGVLAQFSLVQIGYKRTREPSLPFSAPQR
jgi:type II secretory pathway pseudopilin PulG